MEINIQDAVFIPGSNCPTCGKRIDATSGVEVPVPQAGDFSICFYCGQLMVFGDDERLRTVAPEEMEDFRKNSPEGFALANRLSRIFAAKRARRRN